MFKTFAQIGCKSVTRRVFLKIEVTLCFSVFRYERLYLAALRFEEP